MKFETKTCIVEKFFSRALETGRKASLWWAFLPVSQRVQINFIFNDNVRILSLTCNIKKSKHNCQIVYK